MDVKEFLEKGRNIKIEIRQLEEAKQNASRLACGKSTVPQEVKASTSRENHTEQKFTDSANYSALLEKKERELVLYRITMLKLIEQIPDTIHRTLLIARYINCKTWERIAEEMGYSDVWVRTKLHSAALCSARLCFDEKKYQTK